MDGVPVVVAIDVGREQRGVKTELTMKESGEIGVGQFDTGRVKYSEQFNAIAGTSASARVVSGNSSREIAMRSRSSMGAVL